MPDKPPTVEELDALLDRDPRFHAQGEPLEWESWLAAPRAVGDDRLPPTNFTDANRATRFGAGGLPRCEGTARSTGRRCGCPAVRGSRFCQRHGAGPQLRANREARLRRARSPRKIAKLVGLLDKSAAKQRNKRPYGAALARIEKQLELAQEAAQHARHAGTFNDELAKRIVQALLPLRPYRGEEVQMVALLFCTGGFGRRATKEDLLREASDRLDLTTAELDAFDRSLGIAG